MPHPRPIIVFTGGTRLTDAWLDRPVPDDAPHHATGLDTGWLDGLDAAA